MTFRPLVLILVLASSPLLAATSRMSTVEVAPADVPAVTGYEIVADPVLASAVAPLKDRLMANVGKPFSRALVEADVKTFQDLGTVAMVRTAQRPYKGGTKLCYRVEANPVIRSIAIEGLALLDVDEVLAGFGTQPGQVLDYKRLFADLNTIPQRCLSEKGVMWVDVIDPKDVTVVDGAVTVRVREFTMGDLTIEGVSGAEAKLVRRTFQPQAGKPVVRAQLLASLCDIYQLSLVRDLDWNPKFDRESGRVHFTLMVTPADERQAAKRQDAKPRRNFIGEKSE